MAPVINGRNLYRNIFNNSAIKRWMPKNPTPSQLANLALASTLAKDGINCYYYTTQSLHNDKIPEEKRKFVAALDLSNGIMNIAVPLAAKPLVDKYTEPLFNKCFGKYFNKEAGEAMADKMKDKRALKFVTENARKIGLGGFSVIIMLVFSQILCKRIITPTISTPMADVFKKKLEQMEEKNKKINAEKEAEAAQAAAEQEDDKTEESEETKKVSDDQPKQPITETKVESSDKKQTELFSSSDFGSIVAKPVTFKK